MIIIDALNLFGSVASSFETPAVDVSEFESIRSYGLSTISGGLRYYWSVDGILWLLSDNFTIDAGVAATYSIPIKAKFLKIQYNANVYPAVFSAQHLFQSGPLSLSTLSNLGAGVQLYNSVSNGIKSVVSDGSVSISGSGTELTVSAANGMILAANSDVQIVKTPGVFTVGIGQGAQRGANSLYITGENTSGNVGLTTSTIGVGGSIGVGASCGPNSVLVGFNSGNAGCGTNCTLIGRSAGAGGGGGTNRVAVGYQAGGGVQGGNSVSIGSYTAVQTQSTNCVSIGRDSGINQGANTIAIGSGAAGGAVAQGSGAVAVGYNAAIINQGTNAVAIGSGSASSNQGASAVAIGNQAGNISQGEGSIAIGNQTAGTQGINSVAIGTQACSSVNQGARCIAIGYRASQLAAQPNNSVAIGANCVAPGANGRLAFGNAMEVVAATAAAGASVLPAAPEAFIPIEWNGVLYKIPVYNN